MAEKEPQLDQDGKMINPHNPEFITKVPWYLGSSGPTLKHHNIQKADHYLSITESDALIQKKIESQKVAQLTAPRTIYRKGACKNCGAMTHTEKNCVERPRSGKKAAWKTGVDIAPDEVSLRLEEHGKVSFDAKRDQWKGYDPQQYKEVIQKHERIEMERALALKQEEDKRREAMREEKDKRKAELEQHRKRKAEQKLKKQQQQSKNPSASSSSAAKDDADWDDAHDKTTDSDHSTDSDSDSDSDSDAGSDEESGDDEAAAAEKEFLARDEQMGDFQGGFVPQGGLGGAGMRQTVRNLRIREDMPKYLRNLDLNSAFYDPKSRAMRANPLPNENPEDLAFAGDNFVRYTGDAVKLAQNQLLCWEMQARGESIDVLSNPSQAELIQRQFAEKKKELESEKRSAILAKYTDGQANPAMDSRLKLGQTEAFMQYTRDGRLAKGSQPTATARTKYEEDVYVNNHTSVWGSYYNRAMAAWGYACCHSLLRNAYCTGAKGRAANDAANQVQPGSFQARKMLEAKPMSDRQQQAESALASQSKIFGESSAAATMAYDPDKIKQAQQKAEAAAATAAAAAAAAAQDTNVDGKSNAQKRGYNSMQSVEVTEEDMEVYRMKRTKNEDPMAQFMGDGASDVLLEYKP